MKERYIHYPTSRPDFKLRNYKKADELALAKAPKNLERRETLQQSTRKLMVIEYQKALDSEHRSMALLCHIVAECAN